MSIIEKLFNKKTPNQLKLERDPSGEWMVKKGSSILYIGTKDKCVTYMSNVA